MKTNLIRATLFPGHSRKYGYHWMTLDDMKQRNRERKKLGHPLWVQIYR
jgi:hypothetical protein